MDVFSGGGRVDFVIHGGDIALRTGWADRSAAATVPGEEFGHAGTRSPGCRRRSITRRRGHSAGCPNRRSMDTACLAWTPPSPLRQTPRRHNWQLRGPSACPARGDSLTTLAHHVSLLRRTVESPYCLVEGAIEVPLLSQPATSTRCPTHAVRKRSDALLGPALSAVLSGPVRAGRVVRCACPDRELDRHDRDRKRRSPRLHRVLSDNARPRMPTNRSWQRTRRVVLGDAVDRQCVEHVRCGQLAIVEAVVARVDPLRRRQQLTDSGSRTRPHIPAEPRKAIPRFLVTPARTEG